MKDLIAYIFLDEFESIAGVRRSNSGEGSDVMNRVVNQLLSSMDGVDSMEGVIPSVRLGGRILFRLEDVNQRLTELVRGKGNF